MASILVIDDEIVMCTALRRVLEDAGHQVTEVIDGNEGMVRFQESSVDVVITDMLLPQKSGLAIIKEIRETNRDVKIIAITTLAYDAFDAAEELGANATFEKPIQM
jgi:CheY-like chemotaxis protein